MTILAIYNIIVGIGFNLLSYHAPICIDLSVTFVLLLVLCGIIGAVIFWHKIKKQSPKLVGIEAEKSFNPSRYTIIDTVYLS